MENLNFYGKNEISEIEKKSLFIYLISYYSFLGGGLYEQEAAVIFRRWHVIFCFALLVYSISEITVYSRFLSLTVEKTISYYYLLSLLVPIISYYSFFWAENLKNLKISRFS